MFAQPLDGCFQQWFNAVNHNLESLWLVWNECEREKRSHRSSKGSTIKVTSKKRKKKSYVLWYMLKLVTQWRFLVNGLTHNRSPQVQKRCCSNHVGLTTQLFMMIFFYLLTDISFNRMIALLSYSQVPPPFFLDKLKDTE